MKLFSVMAVGLMLAGPLAAQAEGVAPVAAEVSQLDDCLRAVEQGDEVSAALDAALGVDKHEKCREALNERDSARDQSADEAAIEIRVRERINNGLIARDVLAACTELFAEQKTVAMTNSVCVMAFRQHGHPELDR